MNENIPDTGANAPGTIGLVARLFNSFRQRGVVFTLRAAKRYAINRVSQWIDRGFDFINNTETAGIIEVPDLLVTSVHRDRGIRYQPTRARPFRKLMRALRIPPGQVFIDIGSGKGRVLIIAMDFGFKKIVGVEYAAELCDIARENLSLWRRRGGRTAPVVIHCCDAAEYDFNEGETVIYMFNPFDSVVLGKMLDRLADSLRRAPRKTWLIYYFPRWGSVIESHGMFTPAGLHTYGGCEFAVYTYDPP